MNRHPILVPLLLTAAAAALIYSLLRNTQPPALPATAESMGPRYALQDTQLTRYDAAGRPRLYANASEIDQFQDGRIVGTNLRVTTLRAASAWTATAPHGELEGRGQPLKLSGGVVARGHWPDSGRPVTITTPELWINADDHELYTNREVTLTSTGRSGTAAGMRANWLTQGLSLLNDVHLDYDVPAPR